jgi:Flp pilus assembly protein TadB
VAGRTCRQIGDDVGRLAHFGEFSAFCPFRAVLEVSMNIYMVAFLVLMIAWFLGWIVFGVSSGLIHILLGAAVVSFVLYFFRGRHAEADLRINS